MSDDPMVDEDGELIEHDYRSEIVRLLPGSGYRASEQGVVEINFRLNRVLTRWEETKGERTAASREEAQERLTRGADTFQDFVAAWSSLMRSRPSRRALLAVIGDIDGGGSAITALDNAVGDDRVKLAFHRLASPSTLAALPSRPSGRPSLEPLHFEFKKLIRTLRSHLQPTGARPRTPAVATHSKCCTVASELLALCGLSISAKTLQNVPVPS